MARAKLIESLEEASGAIPLVFVSAGPGWGKTMLLAQWASESQRPFAWVSIDETDNDPIVLLTYVAAALDRVSRLDPGVFEALASAGASVEGTIVPRLGAALATMDQPVVLVLDDLHLLDNPACLDAIAALSRHVSQGSQIALSARGRPALPLGALRARGLALEIGPDDLRMDEAEVGQLLSGGRSGPARRADRRAQRARRGLVRGCVPGGALDQGGQSQGQERMPPSPGATVSWPTT